jgi:hypothetical protein
MNNSTVASAQKENKFFTVRPAASGDFFPVNEYAATKLSHNG